MTSVIDIRSRLGVLAVLPAGHVLGTTNPFVISQIEEDVFACLIGDWDPMHNVPTWQFDSQWQGTIVLGYHVLARVESMLRECGLLTEADGDVTFLTVGLGRMRIPSPFPVGAEACAEVTLRAVEIRDDHILMRTTLTMRSVGIPRPTMTIDHDGVFFFAKPHFGSVCADDCATSISEIPSGAPIAHSNLHDASFYEGVAARKGEWLGSTPWTVIEQREADAFAILTGGFDPLYNDPNWARAFGPFGHSILRPLHLLALRAYFLPQVGLPVLSDEGMAAYNYGLDQVHWHNELAPGTPMRDHVQLLDVAVKGAGNYLVKTRHVLEARGEERDIFSADCLTYYALRTPSQ